MVAFLAREKCKASPARIEMKTPGTRERRATVRLRQASISSPIFRVLRVGKFSNRRPHRKPSSIKKAASNRHCHLRWVVLINGAVQARIEDFETVKGYRQKSLKTNCVRSGAPKGTILELFSANSWQRWHKLRSLAAIRL